MAVARSPWLATGAAALGHGLALTGFLLPWVVGQFGVRQQLSGLDLTRLAGSLISQGLAGEILALPIARVALLLVPLAAANALVLLALIRIRLLPPRTAQRLAFWFAVPIALVSFAGLALVLVSVGDGSVIAGPGLGLPLAIAGSLLALASIALPRHLAAGAGN